MQINSDINYEYSAIILYLNENFEFDDSALLEKTIITQIDKHSLFNIIINFKNIKYMNSYSLNEFVQLYSKMLKTGISIFITELSENVSNLFQTTSLHILIPIYPSNDAAFKKNNL
ncbi:MAG: STAS domain-containing protein [Candidatus Muirbacterium halophilum]|nr:STAS domain-containing protein [Candidatus Muirbacterium halophilum]MCK9474305.1 STAS domain-containing protein [Candidatus Muirbacterium halophilum]